MSGWLEIPRCQYYPNHSSSWKQHAIHAPVITLSLCCNPRYSFLFITVVTVQCLVCSLFLNLSDRVNTLFLKVILFIRKSLYLAYFHSDSSVFELLAPSTGRISNSAASSRSVTPGSSAVGQPQPSDQDTLVQRAEHIPAGKRTPMCAHCNQVIRLVVFWFSWNYLIPMLVFF